MRRKKQKSKRLWIALIALAGLAPLGLWIINLSGAGGMWGEWGPEELGRMAGHEPEGLKKLNNLWDAPLAGYEVKGIGPYAGYLVSALGGAGVVLIVSYLITRALARRPGKGDKNDDDE